MAKKEFLLKNYKQNIGSHREEIEKIGAWEADVEFHYDFYTRAFRVYIPELDCTLRETYIFSPYASYEEITKTPKDFTLYLGDEADPNEFYSRSHKLKEVFADIAEVKNIPLEKVLEAKAVFILDEW